MNTMRTTTTHYTCCQTQTKASTRMETSLIFDPAAGPSTYSMDMHTHIHTNLQEKSRIMHMYSLDQTFKAVHSHFLKY